MVQKKIRKADDSIKQDGLIADGTNVNAANHFGYTPIHLAALVGNAAGLGRSGQGFST